MTKDEILSAVREIYFGKTDNSTVSGFLDKLEEALPHADISDLIFHDFRGLTPVQVVEEAMQREADYARHASSARQNEQIENKGKLP